MKTYWKVEVQFHVFITLALDGGEWSVLRSGRFTPEERAPDMHLTGGWMELRAGLDAMEKRLMSCPCRESNPVVQPVP
jgi:hypothetical protein